MNYPLLLDYQDTLFGRGFVAEITACGRLLATEDDGEWWIAGVNPGAIAADGETLDEAHATLRHALQDIMRRFADEATSFEGFKAAVTHFFEQTNDPTLAEWREAVEYVRRTKTRLDDLPTKPADKEPYVCVFQRSTSDITPENNITRVDAALAKAA